LFAIIKAPMLPKKGPATNIQMKPNLLQEPSFMHSNSSKLN